MRTLHLTLSLIVLAFPALGRAQNPAPLLSSAEPLRRLGASEFRLPLRDSNERIFQFSSDGKLLAACNGIELRMWTFPDGKLVHDFSDSIDSDCIAFSDGRELLALEWRGRGERAILGFNVKSGKVRRGRLLERVRQNGETHYTFLDHGRWVCSTDNDSKLSVWDANTNRLMLLKPSVRSGRHPVASNGILTSWDGASVERIDLKTGDRLTRFNNYMKRIGPVCTPDGTLMAGYSRNHEAIVFWKSDTNKLIGRPIPFAEQEWQSSQAAGSSANGKRLVFWTGTGGYFARKIGVYDIETGQLVCEFAPPDIYFTEEPIISPDGKWVFLTGQRCAFTVVNADTGQPLREIPDHILDVEQLSFTPDGSTLIAGSKDQRRAWNVATGQPGTVFLEYYHTPYVAAVDNRRAIISGLPKGGVQLQDIPTGEIERFFDLGHPMHLTKFQLSADRKTFSGQSGETYRRWDIATGKTLYEWTPPEQRNGWGEDIYGRYTFAGFALGGSRLVRFEEVRPGKRLDDGKIDWGQYDLLLEDWATQKVTNRFSIPYVGHFNLAESSDDRTLVVVTSDDWSSRASNRLEPGLTYLLVWDVITGEERMRVTRPRPDYYSAFSMAAVTPDARLIATCRNRGQIELWHGFTGELIQRFDAPIDVTKLAFSDDGTILASGHIEGSIYLWDTRAARGIVNPRKHFEFPGQRDGAADDPQ